MNARAGGGRPHSGCTLMSLGRKDRNCQNLWVVSARAQAGNWRQHSGTPSNSLASQGGADRAAAGCVEAVSRQTTSSSLSCFPGKGRQAGEPSLCFNFLLFYLEKQRCESRSQRGTVKGCGIAATGYNLFLAFITPYRINTQDRMWVLWKLGKRIRRLMMWGPLNFIFRLMALV